MELITIKNAPLQSASYIIGNDLIDCGDAIVKEAISRKITIKGIIFTHCHQDLIYGLPQVMETWGLSQMRKSIVHIKRTLG